MDVNTGEAYISLNANLDDNGDYITNDSGHYYVSGSGKFNRGKIVPTYSDDNTEIFTVRVPNTNLQQYTITRIDNTYTITGWSSKSYGNGIYIQLTYVPAFDESQLLTAEILLDINANEAVGPNLYYGSASTIFLLGYGVTATIKEIVPFYENDDPSALIRNDFEFNEDYLIKQNNTTITVHNYTNNVATFSCTVIVQYYPIIDNTQPDNPDEPILSIGYHGQILGTGEAETRENEITADVLASSRNFIVGYNLSTIKAGGIIKDNEHDFSCSIDENDNTILHLTDGVAFAYSYFGYCTAVDITIFPPAVEQYHIIYAEFDKSVIPNVFAIKTKNNQSSPNVLANSFRQDQLSTVKTGVFQLPLWSVRVTNEGIDEFGIIDLREKFDYLKSYIEQVYYTETTDNVISELEANVTAVTAAMGDISGKVATTEFADKAIQEEINK